MALIFTKLGDDQQNQLIAGLPTEPPRRRCREIINGRPATEATGNAQERQQKQQPGVFTEPRWRVRYGERFTYERHNSGWSPLLPQSLLLLVRRELAVEDG